MLRLRLCILLQKSHSTTRHLTAFSLQFILDDVMPYFTRLTKTILISLYPKRQCHHKHEVDGPHWHRKPEGPQVGCQIMCTEAIEAGKKGSAASKNLSFVA
ncbi:hypothetical protein BC938DRAFT_478672 [Jimgerdemannia flammicorona]|uniref:Uncharacterized protein n=1 Tax=Jimgerdemannia flammicorona TaxID=994334 RepID=A0A433QMF6_9FUNG|nr:hypothetical protein BC938DRAFT_478672 [Jimgerdemannia flammicorona]